MRVERSDTALTIVAEPPPLTTDVDGVVRVGGTRVTLDTLVQAFREGATAEEIVFQYPALRLADVYSALGYYLQWQDEVEVYLEQRARDAAAVRGQAETSSPISDIRARLLARRDDPDVASGC